MIAIDHPLIGVVRTFDLSNHVPNNPALIVLLRNQVHLHPGRSQVITKRQRALPALRNSRPLKVLEDRRGIVVADGDGDDAGLIA